MPHNIIHIAQVLNFRKKNMIKCLMSSTAAVLELLIQLGIINKTILILQNHKLLSYDVQAQMTNIDQPIRNISLLAICFLHDLCYIIGQRSRLYLDLTDKMNDFLLKYKLQTHHWHNRLPLKISEYRVNDEQICARNPRKTENSLHWLCLIHGIQG